jgi:peptide-methionine (R)-S-oxide reductase
MPLTWKDIIYRSMNGNPSAEKRVEKSPEEWKETLDPDVFQITRLKGTERAFSSEMCSLFEPGIYACACCGTRLFNANEKFKSGSGWPSFSQPLQDNSVAYIRDASHGMIRVETICNVCDAHLGHVFPDGPPPSGLRYCINALALSKILDDHA